MNDVQPSVLTMEEVLAEGGTMLPSKEVLSLLDLNVDIDLLLDLVAPIDLAIAGNLNIAAPISGAVSANVLSLLSNSAAVSDQGVMLTQDISGSAIATAPQTATVDQSDAIDGGTTDGGAAAGTSYIADPLTDPTSDGGTAALAAPVTDPATAGGTTELADPVTDPTTADVSSLLDGDLLNVNVNVDLDADLAAPVAGAVALNANVAAPINASVAANVGSVGSEAIAGATQQAIITQTMDVEAEATATQNVDIEQ
jgi:hypothetical protein